MQAGDYERTIDLKIYLRHTADPTKTYFDPRNPPYDATHVIQQTLSQSIKNSIRKGFLLDNAKVDSVTPVDDICSVLNFCTVNVLNFLYKVYENSQNATCGKNEQSPCHLYLCI